MGGRDAVLLMVENPEMREKLLYVLEQAGLGFVTEELAVAEHRRAEALKENERKYRELFEGASDAILVTEVKDDNTPGRFVEANGAATRMLGYSRDQMLTMTPRDIGLQREDLYFVREPLSDSSTLDVTLVAKDGNEIQAEGCTRVVEVSGSLVLMSIIRDITERNRAEEKLRTLSRAIEQSPECIVITDSKGDIEYINPKFSQLTGFSPEEALGENPRILMSGETPDEVYKVLWETITTGGVWRGEFHNKKKNGELYWESASISGVKNADGVISHFIGVKEDISERKRTEEALLESERRFRDLFETANDAIFIVSLGDRPGRILDANDVACKRLGYSRERCLH